MSRLRGWTVGALIAFAARMLPRYCRARYRSEWTAELHSVAPREQVPYAVRVLVRTWALRMALYSQDESEGGITMPSKPLKCRFRLHKWVVRRNEEDATRYEQCTRCLEERVGSYGFLGSLQ